MTINDPIPAFHVNGPCGGMLVLSGELDMASVPQLEAAVHRLVDTGIQSAVFEVSNLTFCDSIGLGVFVATHNKLPGGLTLRSPSAQLQMLLQTTGLDTEFHLD